MKRLGRLALGRGKWLGSAALDAANVVFPGMARRGLMKSMSATVQFFLMLLSILGILAAGDAFVLNRRSILEDSVVKRLALDQEKLENIVQSELGSISFVPPLPAATIGDKKVFVGSFEAWKSLTTKLTGLDKGSFEVVFERSPAASDLDVAMLSDAVKALVQNDSLLRRLVKRALDRGVPPQKINDVVESVVRAATVHTVVIQVANSGDGDSGSIEVKLPANINVTGDDLWEIGPERALIRSLKPHQRASLTFASSSTIEFAPDRITLNNSTSRVVQWFWWLVLICFIATLVVLAVDLRISPVPSEEV